MKELIEAGLFGRGLVQVDSSVLVKRYNDALEHLGLEQTKLKTFQIDQMGWSPEIADEKGNDYYLSHGASNPLAIILTPEQASAPVYFPFHSFDWRMMYQWFKTHKVQIQEVTKETAICLDLDEEVDHFAAPSDLLMVQEVMVRASTPSGLMDHARRQHALVHRWNTEDDVHLDEELLLALVQTAQEQGDLRKRSLIIRDFQFSDVTDFYSKKFGGAFVLRSQNSDPRIFARDMSVVDDHTVFKADETALEYLLEHGYVETSINWWQDHLFRLKVIAESFLVDVLDKEEARLDYGAVSKIKRKALLQKYQSQLDEHLELTRVRSSLKRGEMPEASSEIMMYLFHPSDSLSNSSREVVWQLLTYIQGGRFVPLMYRHQKTAFVEGYAKKWKNPRRSWALARVQEFYDVASKSSGLEL